MTTTLTPPESIGAEAAVLGAMLVSDPAPGRVIDEVRLEPDDFYFDRHRVIYRAMVQLHRAGKPCDQLTVVGALKEAGQQEEVGGEDYLFELSGNVSAPGNVQHHAEIVQRLAMEREALAIGAELAGGRLDAQAAAEKLRAVTRESGVGATSDRLERGGSWLLDTPEQCEPVWGVGDQVLWSKGEPLIIAGMQGVGKTTLAQEIALARCGVGESSLLGLPIAADPRPVLYIAADRPEQARRSFARMVEERDREKLDGTLIIWRGPPPVNVIEDPSSLARWVKSLGVRTTIMDSLKDLAVGLAEDAVGAAVNQAVQEVVAEGIEFAACHHQRKSQDGRKPKGLDDVYGSVWITAGAGSVVLLWGKPGDAYVELIHLKQPAAEVGPMEVCHDHERGVTTVPAPVDLVELARHGIEVKGAASRLFSADSPDKNQIERARRKLDRMVSDGLLDRHDPGRKKPVVYTTRTDHRVILRDDERVPSREASRPITQTQELAPRSITPPSTAHQAANGRPSDPLKGAADSDRDAPLAAKSGVDR